MPTPAAWKDEIKGPTIQVLPLVPGNGKTYSAGWCSYDSKLVGYPDVEIFCGGINTKTSTAAGLWRQGNLLHFGFDQSPAEMTDVGRAMLVNSIHYISRFTEDRATAWTASPFAGPSPRTRAALLRMLANEDYPVRWVTDHIDPALIKSVDTENREKFTAWFEQNMVYLRPTESGVLNIDNEARALQCHTDELRFFELAIAALANKGDDAEKARVVLQRYGPRERPAASAGAEEWRKWLEGNRPYLFYNEHSAYRWSIDALAKKRGVPTDELRGSNRADAGPR